MAVHCHRAASCFWSWRHQQSPVGLSRLSGIQTDYRQARWFDWRPLLGSRCWVCGVGCTMLGVRCWCAMLGVRCWVCDVGCPMLCPVTAFCGGKKLNQICLMEVLMRYDAAEIMIMQLKQCWTMLQLELFWSSYAAGARCKVHIPR